MSSGLDPRAVAGLRGLLDRTPEPIGWKIGLNVPAVRETLDLEHEVIAPIPRAGLITGRTVAVGDWTSPFAEPEIAITLRRDVEPDSDPGTALAAIDSLAPAIELVDIDMPLTELEPILERGVFHRGVVFGAPRQDVALSGVAVRVTIDGHEVANAQASSVDLADTITLVADLLGAAGGRLRAGERIIAGSLTRPVPIAPGTNLRCDFGPLGEVALDTEEPPP